MARNELGPHVICKAGLHCLALTGVTYDGRCLMCRRDSHREAQRRYERTLKGRDTDSRYKGSAKGALYYVRDNAKRRTS